MAFPVVIHLWDWTITGHALLEFPAHVLGVVWFWKLRSRSKDPLSREQRWWLIFSAALGAVLGSKLIGIVETMTSGPMVWNTASLFKSKTIVGGLLGGWLAVELAKKVLGIRRSSGDLFVFPLILGMIVGRLGCFSAGVFDGTHGVASTLPWALDMGDGVKRHPTQLYEIVFLVLLTIVLLRYKPFLVEGGLFRVFLVTYLMFRFLSEFIKPVPEILWHLSGIQWTCLIGLCCNWRLFTFFSPTHKPKGADAG